MGGGQKGGSGVLLGRPSSPCGHAPAGGGARLGGEGQGLPEGGARTVPATPYLSTRRDAEGTMGT